MKKNIIKLFIIFIFILSLNAASVQVVSADIHTPKVAADLETGKHPKKVSRTSIMFKKFLVAMLCVACSGCAIYLLLVLYIRVKPEKTNDLEMNLLDENSFATPTNIDSAIKLFLTRMK